MVFSHDAMIVACAVSNGHAADACSCAGFNARRCAPDVPAFSISQEPCFSPFPLQVNFRVVRRCLVQIEVGALEVG